MLLDGESVPTADALAPVRGAFVDEPPASAVARRFCRRVATRIRRGTRRGSPNRLLALRGSVGISAENGELPGRHTHTGQGFDHVLVLGVTFDIQ